jgi:replicative DNA helicase
MSDVEKAVIGSVLLDSSVLPFAMAEISSNDFLDPELEVLWQGMIRMRTTGKPIDPLTVSGNMTAWGVKRLTAADLWKMIDSVPHAHSVASYAKQVRDDSLRRALVDAGRNILDW